MAYVSLGEAFFGLGVKGITQPVGAVAGERIEQRFGKVYVNRNVKPCDIRFSTFVTRPS